jgi:hypothetical protein
MTEQPLKPVGILNDPNHILRCRYTYTSETENYYILADFEINYIDGVKVSFANWYKFNYDDEEYKEEHHTSEEEFNKMIDSEGYIREGHEFVISN